MATYTRTASPITGVPAGLLWEQSAQWSVSGTPTTTSVTLVNTDGTITTITGSGFVFGVGNLPTAGTVNGAVHTSADGLTTFETITGAGGALLTVIHDAIVAGTIGATVFAGADTLTGNALADVLSGYAGDDTITGAGGNDTIWGGDGFDIMRGGAGNDVLHGGTQALAELESGPSQLWVGGRADYATSNGVTGSIIVNFDTVATVTGDITVGTDTLINVQQVRGTDLADTFTVTTNYAGLFSDFAEFEGRGGNDTINGNGNTRINFQSATVGVVVNLAAGTATFIGPIDGVGAGAVGVDSFTGLDPVTGDTGVNSVRGSAQGDNLSGAGATGNLTFIGLAGDDTITGGTHADNNFDSNSARYDNNATAGITATLGTAAGANFGAVVGNAATGTDTLIGVERVRGTDFADSFTATATWSGQYGTFNDFEGLGGNDVITGNGHTRVNYSKATGGVTVDLQAGTAVSTAPLDAAKIGVDSFTGVNQVRGSDYADTLLGRTDASAENFRGGIGNDTIDGRGGALDSATYSANFDMTGGILVTLVAGGATVADGLGGIDTLINIEGIGGSEFNDTITGDGNGNYISGQGGDDTINGGAGADVITGDDTDITPGAPFGITPDFDVGNDVINGDAGNDTLFGAAGADIIHGGDDNDSIDGGIGADQLFGDAGDDRILFNAGDTAFDGGIGTDTLVLVDDPTAPGTISLVLHGFEFGERVTTDLTNTQTWSKIVDHYDSAWGLLTEDGTQDNGGDWHSIHDTTVGIPWHDLTDYHDASGQITNRFTANDDGTRYETVWDYTALPTGLPWSNITDYYNTSNQLYLRAANNDDTTSYLSYYDFANADPNYKVITDDYHLVNGVATLGQRNAIRDDDTRYTSYYDSDPAAPKIWSSITDDFNIAGQLFLRQQFNDDGSRQESNFDYTPEIVWQALIRDFNPAGVLILTTQVNDDGTIITF